MSVCVIIPCYNEAERLDAAAFAAFIAGHQDISFCFVDDGSTDETLKIIRAIETAAKGRAVSHVLDRNRGKAEAVRQGMLRMLGADEYIGYWDADLATPLAHIPDFAEVLDCNPQIAMVAGSRIKRLGAMIERRGARHLLGRVFATVASLVLGLDVYDTQCGAKLLRSEAAHAAFERPFVSKWIFDVELFARLRHMPVYEFPLMRWRDVAGSHLRLRHWIVAAMDMLRIRAEYRDK